MTPCVNCKRTYPTDEFIGKDGICIVCRNLEERRAELLGSTVTGRENPTEKAN